MSTTQLAVNSRSEDDGNRETDSCAQIISNLNFKTRDFEVVQVTADKNQMYSLSVFLIARPAKICTGPVPISRPTSETTSRG